MITARLFHTATLLNDGRVLITGGVGPTSPGASSLVVANAELYDPSTGMFTPAATYVGNGICDFCGPATLLANGKTLFTWQQPAQLYDPVAGTFRRTGAMIQPDHSTATLLMDGTVLFTGGVNDIGGRSSSAELYNPATGTFALVRNMGWRRVWQTATLLPDGTVLVAGGDTEECSAFSCTYAGSIASAELYDPSTRTFTATGDMTALRSLHQATLLNDGRVLITGGVSYGGIGIFFGSFASAELYTPPSLVPVPIVTDLRFDRTSIAAGTSYSVDISGSNLTSQTFFDVRFSTPGSNASDVVLNWQRGVAANHDVSVGTAVGSWTINGVRAHEVETDHTGNFVPVKATILVSP
jgi:hypothetical protein